MHAHWKRLARWFEGEAATPIAGYRRPLQKLAQRAAAAVLLGESVEHYRPDLEAVADKAQGILDWGDLAAATLLVSNTVDESVHKCVTHYTSNPDAGGTEGVRADEDELALATALFTGNLDVAGSARSHRVARQIDSGVPISAELVFLADEARRRATGDALVFATVRGIHRSILASVGRSVAPFIWAFAAVAGKDVSALLRGRLRQYDELSFAGENAPYRLLPDRLEVVPDEPRIRLLAHATGDGFRLDVIHAPPLLDDLPVTLDKLRGGLAETDKRRFNKLRKSADTELEVALLGVSSVEYPDVFARRVAAALALMALDGYAIEKVIVTAQAAKD